MKLNRKGITRFNDTRDTFAIRYVANVLKKRHTFPRLKVPCLEVIKKIPHEFLPPDIRDCLAHIFPHHSQKNGDEEGEALKELFSQDENDQDELDKEQLIDRLIHVIQQSEDDINDPLFHQIRQNVGFVAELLDLNDMEQEFLLLVGSCRYSRALDDLGDYLLDTLKSASDTVSCLLDISREEAHKLILPEGSLRQSGVLLIEEDDHSFYGWFKILPRLEHIIARPYERADQLQGDILTRPRATDLVKDDFSHLHRDQDLFVRLLGGAAVHRAQGINILIHGPPGTGKTEFAKVAAKEAGLTLYPAGEVDEKGFEPMRGERLQDFLFLQKLLGSNPSSAVLVDEAEDLFEWSLPVFRGNSASTGSKVFLNRLLEDNTRPVVWIVNDITPIPARVRRRMTFSIRMGMPPSRVRARIWQRMAHQEKMPLDQADTDRLARYTVSPGVGGNGLRAATLCGGTRRDVEHVIVGLQKTLSGKPLGHGPEVGEKSPPDLGLFNTDTDLSVPVERLAECERRDISFCFYGHPGTGKTELAHYLAEVMGIDVLEKRASDLLGPYVGQTEAAIANAFQQALDQDALLVFDEADSLLAERTNAGRQHEITQVNEMLSQMERHPLPFVCTTNLMARIDRASLRRFTFKVQFDYLTVAMAHRAFRHYFGVSAGVRLRDLSNLTPADFAVVRKRAEVMGGIGDADHLLDMLGEESHAKPDGRKQPIGFHVAQCA